MCRDVTRGRAGRRLARYGGALLVAAAISGAPADAAVLAGAPLMAALHQGGYVLVMRHARAPPLFPDVVSSAPGGQRYERRLDASGRKSARAMGGTIRALQVSLGSVFSSPARRALETARLVSLQEPTVAEELGEEGAGTPDASSSQGLWLQRKAAESPAAGTNTLIVTHSPIIWSAFGAGVGPVAEGEVLVFQPDGADGARLVGRVRIEEWPANLPR